MANRHFGEIDGIEEGATFASRKELSLSGVHRPYQAGICGSKYEGAESIVLSGGYEDDIDNGDVIIYTGHGGNVSGKSTQFQDQDLDRQNMALALSSETQTPVRVIRGARHKSPFSPQTGFQYAGLYRVARWWEQKGKSGFRVFRFELVKIGSESDRQLQLSQLPNATKVGGS
jgi:putative restriction endonuclease